MDKIQKTLVKLGHTDLAQEYYQKIALKPSGIEKEFTAYNLAVHQIINKENINAALKWSRELEKGNLDPKHQKSIANGIRRYFIQLKQNAPKIESAIKKIEDQMQVCERKGL